MSSAYLDASLAGPSTDADAGGLDATGAALALTLAAPFALCFGFVVAAGAGADFLSGGVGSEAPDVSGALAVVFVASVFGVSAMVGLFSAAGGERKLAGQQLLVVFPVARIH